ncbi:AAA domain-containing protein [Bacteroidales bacterium OttesenSCG-928-A17]|nr:AAA domain-containing protein [Bacteroidales bacterium OttesenSCG-928-A17]
MKELKSLRIIYEEHSGSVLIAKTEEGERIIVRCTINQAEELNQLQPFIQEGNHLNLLRPELLDSGEWIAEFLIFEPDYLLDVSSLAECYKPYGSHPLNYFLSRLQNRTVTAPILLGNAANFFIDECINENADTPIDYLDTLKKLFRSYPFEFSACEDLRDPKKEMAFFENCRKHFNHIRQIVNVILPKTGIDKTKIILEPSFISNELGLQGRLDVLSTDYSFLIELKSGKAVEDFRTGGQFMHSAKNHFAQVILYLALLEFTVDRSPDQIDSYLLYSKYPLLSKEKNEPLFLREILHLRNRIVAYEYDLARSNEVAFTQELLDMICADKLNEKQLSGVFFDNYLRPSIDQFRNAFQLQDEQEKTYYLRLYTFIQKELVLSKTGEREYEGVKKASVLWNAPLEDKLLAGELLYDLMILDNQAASESHTITLRIPEYENLYLPNFRSGDAVILYERNTDADTVSNRQVFKGSIERLTPEEVCVRLRYSQKNKEVWNPDSNYAIMHDYMDTTYTGMFRGLSVFLSANQERKDLLLCRRQPEKGECYLLVGPPGTGKTSVSLKRMVQDELQNNTSHILLLSYTNRAVDEICRALTDIHPDLPFIRIGSELNCDCAFRNRLLENQLKECKNRDEVAKVIRSCRIFIGTVASVSNKPELFNLKTFDLAIIDEATQLLEPHLTGILCAKNSIGDNAIRRFVLIGDHKQLPAVVLQSREDSKVNELILNQAGLYNLSDSLFERMYHQYIRSGWGDFCGLLTKQGRMHPEISAFPSRWFYEGKLDSVGLPHQTEEWANRKRLFFHPVTPFLTEHSEKINRKEAEKVVAVCKDIRQEFLQNGGSVDFERVGVITPFRNQIALIRKCLQEADIPDFLKITVDTVERFQGSQRDIIIYSFCIKNEGQLSSLPNVMEENGKIIDRKLNVVLTRARKQLHIIGNETLLRKNAIYNDLIDFIQE